MKRVFVLIMIVSALMAGAAPKGQKSKKAKKPKTTKVVKASKSAERPEREPFVTRLDAPTIKKGLAGKNIALWQSHGRYFDLKDERWKWQRARLMGTVEDLYTQSYVLPFLVPMLENAGAYVMMPRERDLNTTELIVDMDGGYAAKGYEEKNGAEKWQQLPGRKGFAYRNKVLTDGENPFRNGTVRASRTVTDPKAASTARWYADLPEAGDYAVYVSYASLPESSRDARYTVRSERGSEEFEVNQRIGGGTWVYLGTFPFGAGRSKMPVVELSNLSSEKGRTVTADAVKIGGGMGNVARSAPGGEAATSGYPRSAEGARYWLQWAGMPESVYSITEGQNDYEDDYKSRGLWVNYLAGGSSQLPGREGLGIPVDLSFALHSDAGKTDDPVSAVGTMPIIYTKGEALGSGESRRTNERYATMVTDEIIRDIRLNHEPTWTLRKTRDRAYHEAAEPGVPALLVELLSHQNYADMRLGLDPDFRFTVSRAIYKGMLKYLHEKDGTPYTVQPLPVSSFSITGSEGEYLLNWQPTKDPLEPTAVAEYYIVYERTDDGAFTELAVVDDPRLSVTVDDSRIYSYKVVAVNAGGMSFPSETLALCNIGAAKEQVTIVNGFTRVSGPAEVYGPGRVGFDYAEDLGVPYMADIHFTGTQTEFRPRVEWKSDDTPGHGASHADFETKIIPGNTFDFVYVHGRAIREAGHSFVSSSAEAFAASVPATEIVDLILGKQKEICSGVGGSRKFKPFSAELCDRLTQFCDGGGRLFVSGSYIGSDLFDNPHSDPDTRSADANFGREVLGLEFGQAHATSGGDVREVKSRFKAFTPGRVYNFHQQLNEKNYAVESPESFAVVPGGGSAAILRYCENDYIAGIACAKANYKTVTIGFPFETIVSDAERSTLMKQILTFLSSN